MLQDTEIIELFFSRSEQAICELDKKYGVVYYRLAYNIVNDLQDAEECVNDAYLGVWRTIPPTKPNPLHSFVCKIVRNVSLKQFYRKEAKKRKSEFEVAFQEIENTLPSNNTVESEIETKELVRIIESFLETLSAENRTIFLRRYWFMDTYAEIAKHVGLSEKNISVRLTRLRKLMKQFLFERGFVV